MDCSDCCSAAVVYCQIGISTGVVGSHGETWFAHSFYTNSSDGSATEDVRYYPPAGSVLPWFSLGEREVILNWLHLVVSRSNV
jgi:hypothetical protein